MILAVVLFNRPRYTGYCLSNLAKVRGIQDTTVYFQIDPLVDEVVGQAFGWSHSPRSVVINPKRLGCNGNTFAALERAFADDDFVGLVEDDILLSEDWLEFVQRDSLKSSNFICTYNKVVEPIVNPDWEGCTLTNLFKSYGCAIREEGWLQVKEHWEFSRDPSWDIALQRRYFSQRPDSIVRPKVGRCYNCGSEMGAYCTSEMDWLEHNYTPYWAESLTTEDRRH